ncbi:uncharacterized protein EDB93DRAFT_1247026 [Suillus bovinus]|uniref:uncharacterized protein n=1 Tax=Suillus bovinus TaxID=48563 RepID=UPI001B886C62|nr:uncharacterized protein EDB93DRAFT_1247026 [Suillus bovinus]KAG2156835.1 hypothetical protein EDB93DRAFT_1247026 [Suillus bovinus]
MLNGTCLTDAPHTEGSTNNACVNTTVPDVQIKSGADLDDGEIDNGPTEIEAQVQLAQTCSLAIELSIPHLKDLVGKFLFEQLHPRDLYDHAIIPAESFPIYDGKVSVVNSASSRFYASSDPSGMGGMHREHI